MKKINLFFAFLFVFLLNEIQAQTSIVSLNSSNPNIVWEIKPQAEVNFSGNQISVPGFQFGDYVKGIVPGVVFTSYVAAGKEKDPNFSDNIYKVDETFYNRPFWYRTEFEVPASYKKGQRIWINFDGTNRFADFYLNGTKISGTPTSVKDVSGHMLRSKFDITDIVNVSGKNAVAVLIWDADQKKRRDSKEAFGVASSPTYLAAAGWDWMPYVPGRLAGITGNVYLKISGDVVMVDPWVRSELPSKDLAEISIMPNIQNVSSTNQNVTLSGLIQPGNISFIKNIILSKGETTNFSIDKNEFSQLVINNPKLWWPNGYGDPNLYTCNLKCIIDGKISDEKEIKFGIRKYEYKMIDNKVGWPVLTLYINGQKLFVKGGNWGMSEYLLRCHGNEYQTKISLHKDLNFNMIRCWTGCVTDDEFYDYCDQYGIMVWDDFWLYVAFNDVAQPEAFKANALDKVRRLRNHPCIAVWCGANETHPKPELDNYLRDMIAKQDHNDRLYKSCSNQDGLSGSGWWGNQPPKHHFETSGSNLAWNDPPYPYGPDYGYGFRTEIGTATFPAYESVIKFMPQDQLWPLPTDEQLKNDDNTIYNKHFFGKEASNANPVNYKRSVNTEFGESANLQEFCEKAQLLNIEVMKGMYEAWNDKMWNDASGLLIWMSQSAYPSFVWQTYDYYYDATGAYWGAKKACEHQHIQWNSSSNSIKVINTTSKEMTNVKAMVNVYDLNGKEITKYRKSAVLNVKPSNINEAFVINFNSSNLAFGKKAFASSSTKNMDAAFITDGASGSRWESEYSDPQWIYVDLGKKQKIESVVLKWEAAHAKEYELQVSNDANNWTTVYKSENSTGGTETLKIKPVSARFIKLNCISRATIFGYSLFELEVYGKLQSQDELSPVQFIKLKLNDNHGNLISENFYWRNGIHDEDFTALNNMKEATISCKLIDKKQENNKEIIKLSIKNNSKVIAFANRIRLVNSATKERVLPVIVNENYFSLLPGEAKIITIEADSQLLKGGADILLKQFRKEEKNMLKIEN